MSEMDDAVDRLLVSVSQKMAGVLEELVDEHVAVYLGMFPRFDNDELVSLMRSAVRASISVELEFIAHGGRVEDVRVPISLAEWVRRIAQRELPVSATLRAHRRGQALVLNRYLFEISCATDDLVLASAASRRINQRSFELYDHVFATQIAEAYDKERERWIGSRATVRRAAVAEVIANGTDDIDSVERVLGYRLRRRHVAVLVWKPLSEVSVPIHGLDRAVRVLAEACGCSETPLSVLYDESTMGAWFPVGAAGSGVLDQALAGAEIDPGLRVAVGEPGFGVDGFRLSHRQAVKVRAVSSVADTPALPSVVVYRDVGVVSMLCADIDDTSMWVSAVIGSLAVDTAAAAKLRRTLEVFLETGGSYLATAQQLGVHRNTVKYRVDQAQGMRAQESAASRLDVELALRACRVLGAAVLRRR
ncbi:PucR family transcriptional regulator [Rhodococcus qingshengii]|uniref:PucR family transcriptional regulator n=1 Tax=Rhodococcus qingshengii TaxID=334542 RepID=UPI0009D6E0C8|nr:PucR family transcriptional regulator [Rhodococcus qingshengii]MCZ4548111.1 helix-turn-helix domain-containing protein [Rhodococcus qingshengii]REK75465.1 PucR family transcriptional regulator [Rhodococcus erythropolis]